MTLLKTNLRFLGSSSSFIACQVKSISQNFFNENTKIKKTCILAYLIYHKGIASNLLFLHFFEAYTIFKSCLAFNEKQKQKHRKLIPVFTLTNFRCITDIVSSFTNFKKKSFFSNWGGGRRQHSPPLFSLTAVP